MIYIIGHKSPDLDSVASAVAYARLKNSLDPEKTYIPAIAGSANRETAYAFSRFNIDLPEMLETADGKNLILVDHNEESQSLEGRSEAKVVEVLDHHKIDFKNTEPIDFEARPYGATCTIIAEKFYKENIEIDPDLAGLMLSAILVDTVITKSPTCTGKDVEIIEKLSQIAGIADWKEYGMDLFKVRSSVKELSAEEIIKSDFKDFNFKQGKFGIGQVETADLGEFKDKEDELLKIMDRTRLEGGYHSVILFLTDIIKEGSLFLVSSTEEVRIGQALGTVISGGKVYIDGIISRKKQVAPKFSDTFDK